MEVRNHARQDKQSSRHREQPAERAATIPEEHRRADKHRQQRDSKSVRAFARDPAIVKAARGITDLVLLDLALHSFDGGDRACSGRSYLPNLKDARTAATGPVISLAFGIDSPIQPLSGAAVSLATSKKRPRWSPCSSARMEPRFRRS